MEINFGKQEYYLRCKRGRLQFCVFKCGHLNRRGDVNAKLKSIIENILKKEELHESIEIYLFLEQRFKASENLKEDYVFRSLFSSFYFMKYVGKAQKDRFFEAFNHLKDESNLGLDQMIEYYKKIPGDKFQFSFTTKMLNLINSESPIYDYHIDKFLSIGYYNNIHSKKENEKYTKAISVYSKLKEFYQTAKSDSVINDCIS